MNNRPLLATQPPPLDSEGLERGLKNIGFNNLICVTAPGFNNPRLHFRLTSQQQPFCARFKEMLNVFII